MSGTCYLPDGSISPFDYPCNQNASFSSCCPKGVVCLSNGYCFGTNKITRGTCTDKNFKDSNCPLYCSDVLPYTGCDLFVASNASPSFTTMCCVAFNTTGNGKCDHSTLGSDNPFTLPAGQVITDRTIGVAGSLNQSSNTGASSTGVSNTGVNATVPSPSGPGSSRDATAVGVGVGLPLGVLLLVAVVSLFFSVRRCRKLEREFKEERRSLLDKINPTPLPSLSSSAIRLLPPEMNGTPVPRDASSELA